MRRISGIIAFRRFDSAVDFSRLAADDLMPIACNAFIIKRPAAQTARSPAHILYRRLHDRCMEQADAQYQGRSAF